MTHPSRTAREGRLAALVHEGRAARRAGRAKSDNPHANHRSLEHVAWEIGFDTEALLLIDRGPGTVLEDGLTRERAFDPRSRGA